MNEPCQVNPPENLADQVASGDKQRPIRYGMKYPHRITGEYDCIEETYWLVFHGEDGSSLRVGLSDDQRAAMMRLRSIDPAAMARDLYVSGHIDVDEFERRLDRESL